MNYRCSECGKRFKTVEGTLLHKLKSHANELPSLRKGNQRRRAARNREEQGQDSRGAGEREEGRMAKRKAAQKAYGYNCPVCGDPIVEPQATDHTEEGLAHAECCLAGRAAGAGVCEDNATKQSRAGSQTGAGSPDGAERRHVEP